MEFQILDIDKKTSSVSSVNNYSSGSSVVNTGYLDLILQSTKVNNGIVQAYTTGYGTLGTVTGDSAIYHTTTTNGTTNNGWIWTNINSSTNSVSNIAALDNTGNFFAKSFSLINGSKSMLIELDNDGNLKFNGNIYATGEVSAYGAGSGSGSGGGLISTVYGYSSLGGSFNDSDLNNTFNAYTINKLASRINVLESNPTLSSSEIISALGYTPYNSSNPAGYITNAALSSYATQTYVNNQVAGIVNSAPSTLDTLKELATALGNDPNFATTITNLIGTKQAQLNGTGFVKANGTTISYDNNSYYLASNPNNYISGINSSMVVSALGFTPYSAANPSGYITSSALSGYATQSWVTSSLGSYLPLAGGTLTGLLTANGSIDTPIDNSCIVIGNDRNLGFVKKSGYAAHITTNSTQPITFSKLSTSTITAANVNSGTLTTLATLDQNGVFSNIGGLYTHYTEVNSDSGLKVIRSSNTDQYAVLYGGNGSGYATLLGAYSIGLQNGASTFPMLFKLGDNEIARFAPTTGNLLLGTTNDSAGFKLNINGSAYSTSMYAPIYYDANDTNFYLNPNGSSHLSSLTVDNTISGNISGNANTIAGWGIDNLTKTYNNFITCPEATNLQTSDLQTWITRMYNNGGYKTYSSITTGQWWWVGSYDFNSPVGTIKTAGAMVIKSGENDSSADFKHFLILDAYSELYGITSNETAWKQYARFLNNNNYTSFNNYNSLYASIYYDKDNTAYYCNPAATSVFNTLNINGYNAEGTGININWPTSGYAYLWGGAFNGSNNWINLTNSTIEPNLRVQGTIVAQNRFWTGWDSGESNSMSCSNWFRSYSTSGWYNSTYGGGIWMNDSTWIRTYGNKNFYCDSIIKAAVNIQAPIYYDSDNTGYYLDPASISQLNQVLVGNAASAGAGVSINAQSGRGHLELYSNQTETYNPSILFHKANCYWGNISYDGSFKFRDSRIVDNGAYVDIYVKNVIASAEVTAYSTSDQRLKTNIKPILKALDVIEELEPVTYNWNETAKALNNNKSTEALEAGLIAQEVQDILPEIVKPMYNGEYLGIDYQKLIPYLIGAIKELKLELNQLKNN